MLRYRLRESERTWFPCPAGMNPTLHTLLIQRGIASQEEAERFLHSKKEHLLDPMLLSDMDRAAARIRAAVAAVYAEGRSLTADIRRATGSDMVPASCSEFTAALVRALEER